VNLIKWGIRCVLATFLTFQFSPLMRSSACEATADVTSGNCSACGCAVDVAHGVSSCTEADSCGGACGVSGDCNNKLPPGGLPPIAD